MSQQKAAKELLETIISSLEKEPEKWKQGECTIKHKNGVEIWIANRPYADMHPRRPIDTRPWGYFQRRRLRKAIDQLAVRQLQKIFEKGEIKVGITK